MESLLKKSLSPKAWVTEWGGSDSCSAAQPLGHHLHNRSPLQGKQNYYYYAVPFFICRAISVSDATFQLDRHLSWTQQSLVESLLSTWMNSLGHAHACMHTHMHTHPAPSSSPVWLGSFALWEADHLNLASLALASAVTLDWLLNASDHQLSHLHEGSILPALQRWWWRWSGMVEVE